MAHPFAEKMTFARDKVGVARRAAGQFAPYFFGQFRRATFVSVEAENPVMLRGVESEIAQFAKAGEFLSDDFRAKFTRDFHRAVRAERIHHDDFIRPSDAFEHVANLPRFVEGERVGRNG